LLAAPVYERCGRTVIHIVEEPANQGKSFGTEILDRRGKKFCALDAPKS
jgi:hypothetical protein